MSTHNVNKKDMRIFGCYQIYNIVDNLGGGVYNNAELAV